MKSSIISRIRQLITGKERAVDVLRVKRSELIDALDRISNDDFTFFNPSAELSRDFQFNADEYVRWLLRQALIKISQKIDVLMASIKKLKIKLHFFKRNIRTYIRQIHHFIFNSLDESESDFAAYSGKASI